MCYKYIDNKSLHLRSHIVQSVISALGLLSEFGNMKTKRGRASEKCRKKAGRSSTFDSEVWRSRIQEHTISLISLPSPDTIFTVVKPFILVNFCSSINYDYFCG